MPISFLFFRERKRNEVLHSSNVGIQRMLKERKIKTVGRHLPAENMGIFCVSRIFVGDTGDDSTSLTCHLQSFLPLGRPFGFFWSTNRIGIFWCNQKILCDIHLCSLCFVMSHGDEAERNVKKEIEFTQYIRLNQIKI